MSRRSVRIVVVVVLAVATCFIWSTVYATRDARVLTVSFLDIGQGDAIFVESPSGTQMLIDGGPDSSVLRELAEEMAWFDRSIDVIVATHPDSDHIGGLVDVLERYRVDMIVLSDVEHDTELVKTLEDAVLAEQAHALVARRGQRIDLGGGVFADVLFPDRAVTTVDSNDGSILIRIVYGDTAFMLTGDAPQKIEDYIAGIDTHALHSTVLKVGHHGSKTSTSPLFVGYVAPEYAVFSRGCTNRYGHPHQDVIATLQQFDVTTYDTCTDGRVAFTSDGSQVTVR